MRDAVPQKLEASRVKGQYAKGFNGVFQVMGPAGESLLIVSSTAEHQVCKGWEHVSVSTRKRTPNWREMCFVKDLFWGPEECVVQFHPPASEWISNHPYCLHLWKNIGHEFPRPPSILVGIQELGDLSKLTEAERRKVDHLRDCQQKDIKWLAKHHK